MQQEGFGEQLNQVDLLEIPSSGIVLYKFLAYSREDSLCQVALTMGQYSGLTKVTLRLQGEV